ncbi:hypothetical protein BVAVS116_E0010 (plasmid) [Borreliella valaisiana VS116]|uniref:Uncharacterized protein n=1 Tax=Borreliella valaisiana VS116 TaxID=445987 RepID=C0R8P1_BORVA|nr:hypothetical protein BVAVS116_E0010 [Borreliella valaisiana VS116]
MDLNIKIIDFHFLFKNNTQYIFFIKKIFNEFKYNKDPINLLLKFLFNI